MAKDHYIAQTYLKHFCGNDNLLQRYYKNSIVIESPKRVPTKSVCWQRDWDTNSQLSDPEAVKKFLDIYENKWNESLDKLTQNSYSSSAKEAMSGYIFYMQAMTPLGRDRYKLVMTQQFNTSAKLYYETLSKKDRKLLTEQELDFVNGYKHIGKDFTLEANDEFCHAFVIRMLFKILPHIVYCSSRWQILTNNTNIPFITSDHPVCLLDVEKKISRTFVPLSPKIAIIITPDLQAIETSKNLYKETKQVYCSTELDTFKDIKTRQVKDLNTFVIKTAKDLIITSHQDHNIKKMVEKYKDWRLECVNNEIPLDNGYLHIASHKFKKLEKQSSNNKPIHSSTPKPQSSN